MKEETKIVLGGIWVSMLTLASVTMLAWFQNSEQYTLAVLVWAFAFLSGVQLKSWFVWMKEYIDKKPEESV